MNNTAALLLKKSYFKTGFSKRCFFTFIAVSIYVLSYAQDTFTGTGNWNNAANWSAGIPTATTNVIINGNATINSGGAVCNNITITGTLTLQNDGLTVAGNWVNNGTFDGGGPGGTDNNPTAENVTFTGAAATIGGATVSNFSGLTLNPGAGNTITMISSSINVGTSQFSSGTITLQSGTFDVGAGHSINYVSQQGGNIVSNGGNFKSYGPTGWTLNIGTGFGATFNITGTVTLDNITPTNLSNNGYKIQNNTAGSATTGLHINGYVTVQGPQSQGWAITGNAPVWGPASTLYRDNKNQGFTIGNNGDLSWIPMASGTTGVTPGYPNNIILTDMGSSTNTVGWDPTGAVSIGGTLQLGDGVTTGRARLDNVTSFSSGGIKLVDNSALSPANTELIAPPAGVNFTDKGNFTTDATSIFDSNGGTINFSGSGTQASPQTISTVAGSTIPFANVVVSNNTYVQLQNSVSVAGTLNLTSGIIGTTSTDSLLISSFATNAITGGSATSYVNGRLSWVIAATSTNSYSFPVGAGSGATATYLPLVLSPNTTAGAVVTVQAFNTGSGGTPGPTVTSLSPTEYWSLSSTSNFTSGATVKVTRPTPVGANNALAKSNSATGTYVAIGGTPSGNSISGGSIGNTTPVYISMVEAPLSAVQVSSTNVTCVGSSVGSITVGGSGGTQPYTFQIGGTGAFFAPIAPASTYEFNNLTAGIYEVTVKDNTGATATTTMQVLGSLQINGGVDTVKICPGSSTTLNAVNLLNTTPTYSWIAIPTGVTAGLPVSAGTASAANATISVTPTVNTQYVVTSTLYNDNLLTNPSFESGNSGFQTDFTAPPAGTAPYQSTPGADASGYYLITSNPTNLCQYFTINNVIGGPTATAEDGTLMMAFDGPANSGTSRPWYETITGLTVGYIYKFNYWYREADPATTYPQLQVSATNGTLAAIGTTPGITITVNNATQWTQANYTFTATGTSTTIALTDVINAGTNGNDGLLDNFQFLAPCIVTDTITVTVGNAASAGNISPVLQTICSGGTPGSSITLSNNSNSIIRWEYSTDKNFAPANIKTITPANNTLSAAAIGALALTDSTYFRAVVNGCSVGVVLYTDTVLIAVTPPSVGGTITPAVQTICSGGTPSSSLTLTGNTGTVTKWEYSTDKTFTTNVRNVTSNNSQTFSAASIGGLALTDSTYFRAVVSSGGCTPANSDSVLIAVTPSSVGGTITPAATQTICSGSQPTSNLTVSGYTGTIISWQSSANKTFTSPTAISNTSATLTAATIGPLTDSTYFRAVIQNGSCTVAYSDSVLVAISNAVTAGTIASSQTICSGSTPNSLTLTGNSGPVQNWESSTNINFTNPTAISTTSTVLLASQIGALTDSTYFYAVIKSGTCPSVNSDTILIAVNALPVGGTLSPATTQTICSGSSPTSGLTVSGYTGTISSWQSSTNKTFTSPTTISNASPTLLTATIGPLTDSTYFRAVIQNGNCGIAYSDSVLVAVTPPSVGGILSPSGTQTVCSGSNPADIILSGYTGTIIGWQSASNVAFNSPSSIGNPSATLSGASIVSSIPGTTYYRAIVQNGICNSVYSDSVIVVVDAASVGGTLSPDTTETICSGTAPAFNITLSGQTGNVTEWQSSSNASFSTYSGISDASTTLTGTGIGELTTNTYFRAIVQNGACGAVSSDSLLIIVAQPPTVPIAHDTVYCVDATAIPLSATGTGLIWYTDSGSTTIAPTPSTLIAGSTVYYVASTEGSCESANDSITVTVNPIPDVSYGGTQSVLQGDSIMLNPVSGAVAGLQYVWSPGIYLSSDTAEAPLSKPVADQLYTIKVMSAGGCSDSVSLLVQVLSDFIVPNTFTPNHDGINDTWDIPALPKFPIQWVQVFDRYGQLIYESHGYSTPGWDGTYKGHELPSGTYYYIIELNGIIAPKTGYVTILR